MLRNRHCCIAAALFATACSTQAASQTDVSVTGALVPLPCDVSLSGGNNFDFGTMHTDELVEEGYITELTSSKTLTVNCPAPTSITLGFPIDNNARLKKHGLAGDKETGSLNWVHLNKASGHNAQVCDRSMMPEMGPLVDDGDGTLRQGGETFYRLRLGRWTSYNCPADSFFNGPGGTDQDGTVEGTYMSPKLRGGTGFVKRMEMPLNLRAYIEPRENLEMTGAIHLEGSASVVIIYL